MVNSIFGGLFDIKEGIQDPVIRNMSVLGVSELFVQKPEGRPVNEMGVFLNLYSSKPPTCD